MKTSEFVDLILSSVAARHLKRAGLLRHLGVATLVSGVFLLCGCGSSEVFVPADANATCVVSNPEFATWFESGAVTLDGVVTPANSVTFTPMSICEFYRWSERMFLWLTSPAPPRYGGGGGLIFDSPAFYDVSPFDANGQATFIPHQAGGLGSLALRAGQVGPHKLPIVFDRSGRMFSIEPPVFARSGKQLILNAEGEAVEIERASIGVDGRPIFLDKAGDLIRRARPIIRPKFMEAAMVQEFMIDGIRILLGGNGSVIDVEQGQAGGNAVLQARNGSLVFFRATVNDVFAYFLTKVKHDNPLPIDFDQAQFPTTQAELQEIIVFAAAHGKTLVDPEALIIEVKTSWIETTLLSDLSRFITLKGTIPTYDTSDPNKWVRNGQKTVQLAMVGMHVVGSTKGHPEMIWATFEHVSNVPNAEYSYINTGNVITTVPQNTAGDWLFCADNSAGPFNQAHMQFNSSTGDIVSMPSFNISPSNTIRWKAWGRGSPAANSNTELISINNSVLGKLASDDVRKNYILTGATWTIGGQPPTSTNQVGTNKMANTTMETYHQGSSTTAATGTNCFTCHGTNTTVVSHIFRPLQPLFP